MAERKFTYKKYDKKPIDKNEYGKQMPQAPDLEEAILGAIMNNADCFDTSLKYLRPECFYKEANQKIFEAMIVLGNENNPIDSNSVTHQLRVLGYIDDIGGPYYIHILSNKATATTSIEYHSAVVLDMYIKREMITLFSESINQLYDDKTDMADVYTIVYDRLEALFGMFDEEMIHHIDSTIERALKEIESYSDGTEDAYIRCGDRLWDEVAYTSPGQIISIAASRSAGKTRYLIKIIRGFFQHNNKKIAALWYSLEDSDTKLVRAFASTATGLSDSQMQSKGYTLSDVEKKAITKEMNTFSKWDIDIVNEQESISQISRRFTRFLKQHEDQVCFLIIDNIMLVEDLYNAPAGNPTQTEDKVAGSLRKIMNKATKAGYKVVLIFLHHMTKEMESKFNSEEAYRPKLSHMKGSSRFADICSVIFLLNNPGLHKDLIKKHSGMPDILCVNSDGTSRYVKRQKLLENMMIAEVAKNRDGEVSDDNVAVSRFIVDFKVMSFVELKTLKG